MVLFIKQAVASDMLSTIIVVAPWNNQMSILPTSMFDVGGQRDERRKWIQCFNGMDVTGFIALLQ